MVSMRRLACTERKQAMQKILRLYSILVCPENSKVCSLFLGFVFLRLYGPLPPSYQARQGTVLRNTYLDLFPERARLAPPWPLTSSYLNTASFYYLRDLSSFSLLSRFFFVLPFSPLLFFHIFRSFSCCFVFLLSPYNLARANSFFNVKILFFNFSLILILFCCVFGTCKFAG